VGDVVFGGVRQVDDLDRQHLGLDELGEHDARRASKIVSDRLDRRVDRVALRAPRPPGRA
jgi:hypothetical protein